MPPAAKSYPCKYVFIPASVHEPIEERCIEVPAGDDSAEVMCFIDMCKQHYKAASRDDSAEQQAARKQAFKASLAGRASADVDPAMLDMLAGQQMVEPVALLSNAPATGFVGVFMYCDDQATFKQLPPNPRATQIAAEAGQALQVSGDVFVARYFDNEDSFKRLDFTLAEVSSSAAWIKDARQQLARRSERSGDTQALLQRLQPSSKAGAGPGSTAAAAAQLPAEVERARGNEAFKKSDWQSALEHYTAALKLDANSTAARNNRALTYLNLGMHQEAADDCSAVLAAEPRNAKALLRRAAAYDGLGQAAQAVADLQQVLALEPNNASAAKRLGEVQQKLLPGGDESAADAAPGTPP